MSILLLLILVPGTINLINMTPSTPDASLQAMLLMQLQLRYSRLVVAYPVYIMIYSILLIPLVSADNNQRFCGHTKAETKICMLARLTLQFCTELLGTYTM